MEAMETAKIPTAKCQRPKMDPHYAAAAERAREAARRLQEAGIIDAFGRRVRKDLPPDMHEDQDRDFVCPLLECNRWRQLPTTFFLWSHP